VIRAAGWSRAYPAVVLTQFVYLDAAALEQYVSAVEGGLVTGLTKRSAASGSGEVGADLKLVSGKGARSHEDEESRTLADTDGSRFDRLIQAATAGPEALGWVDVVDADTDMRGIGIGAMVSWECDVYVPDVIRMLSKAGGALDAVRTMRALLPAALALGLDIEGVPGDEQLGAMSGFLEGLGTKTVVVGEDEGTEWQVAGRLRGDVELGELEGRARVVGKVTQVLQPGRWKPFAAFPGMDLVPREQRRQLERQPPAPGKEDEYLRGPALMLEILAIYR